MQIISYKYSYLNYKSVVILLGGGWSSGKSSTSIRLAYKLGIANIIHTDILRCLLRSMNNIKDKYNISLSTYETWRSEGKTYSPQNLYNGFYKQCRTILPLVKNCILEAIEFGKDTIIEGMHLHPELINELDFQSQIIHSWLTYSDAKYEKQVIDRCKTTYRNRSANKYLEEDRSEKIKELNNLLLICAHKNKVITIDIEKEDPLIVLSNLYSKKKPKLPDLPSFWKI